MWILTAILLVLGVLSSVLGSMMIGNSSSTGDQKIAGKGILRVSAILLLLAYAATSLVTVAAGQVGVVTRFGAVTGRELSPGVSLKAPFPFESVAKIDTRVQKQEAEATAASNDLQDVKGKIAVNWHLERGRVSDIYQSVGLDFTDKLLNPAIQESFKATTAKYTAQDLIKRRQEVGQEATRLLGEKLKEYGIAIDSVNIVNLEFSQAFTAAIEQSQVAAQQVIKAQNEVERVKKEAEASIEKARGEAAAQREQAQSITPEYLELKRIEAQQQWISKWNGAVPQTVAGESTLFSLPVGK